MQPITLHFDTNGELLGLMSPNNILESAKYHIIFADKDLVDFNLYPYTYGGKYLPDLKDFETYSLDIVNKIVSTKITNTPLEMTKKSKINDVDLSLRSFLDRNIIIKNGDILFEAEPINKIKTIIDNKINTGETIFSIRSLNKTVDIQNITLDTLTEFKVTCYKLLENIYLKHAQTIACIKNTKVLMKLETIDVSIQIFDELDGFSDGSLTIDLTGKMVDAKYINLATNEEVTDLAILSDLLKR